MSVSFAEIRQNDGHIPLEGLPNTRDLGGLPTKAGRRIAPRLLLRSGTLASATQHDIMILKDKYKVSRVIDLRTDAERANRPDPKDAFPGTQFVNIPLLRAKALGVTLDESESLSEAVKAIAATANERMLRIYRQMMLDKYTQKSFKRFFDELVHHGEGAVLWHCAVGKDRVGMATVLLLSALDIPDDLIVQDYLATNRFMEPLAQKMLDDLSPYGLSHGLRESVRMLNTVDRQFLQAGLDAVNAEYGSLDAFIRKELDVTEEKKGALRKNYLID